MTNDPRIEAAKAGDVDAFQALVDELGPYVHAYLSSRIYEPAAVEDLVQETFIGAWQNLHRYEPHKEIGAWVTGIARNKMLNHFRSKRRKASALERLRHEITNRTEEYLDRIRGEHVRHQIQRLHGCLDELPEDVREMVEGFYLRGESAREVANRLSRTEEAVHAALYRARKRLRADMMRGATP